MLHVWEKGEVQIGSLVGKREGNDHFEVLGVDGG